MKTTLASLCLVAAPAFAQGYLELPATANPAGELPGYSLAPFMQPNARIQMFYDATEVGNSAFLLDELAMRFDGPIPQVGAPGPFTITHLSIKVGVTTIAMPTAGFADNLTLPLTTFYDGPWTYYPDPGSASPHPWGGPNNGLLFTTTTPIPIVIPPGAWLVVDLTMEGNNIASFGFSHAIVDGAPTTGGLTNGSATNYGQGCSVANGAPPATVVSSGLYGPGAAHFLAGSNLGQNAIVLPIFGLANTPFPLIGSNCTLLTSTELINVTFADANGTVAAGDPAATLSLPADPALGGLVLYEQMAALAPNANPWGLVLSDAVAVSLGTFGALGRGTYTVQHDTSATEAHANAVKPFGFALRLHTL